MREVLVFDDDYTPMEFVVTVLEQVIQKSREEASTIMMQARHDGFAISGLYAPAQARLGECGGSSRHAKRTPVVLQSRGRRIDGPFEHP
jgi:ATP-dependent Clp protease adapter protein ClpS